MLVNGTKISGERELAVGDKVGIGSQEMVLHAASEARPNVTAVGEDLYRRATQTLGAAYVMDLRNAVAELAAKEGKAPPPTPAAGAPASPARRETPLADASRAPLEALRPPPAPPTIQPSSVVEPPTAEGSRSVQSFMLLGGVADKALAMGKAEDAERILQVLLNDVMTRARDGQSVDPGITEPAARYAARLAGATGKAVWVDYVFELHRRLRRVLPAAVIDELYSVVRKVKSLELGGIRAYLEALREGAAAFGPADRFLVQRIEGLERQMALK